MVIWWGQTIILPATSMAAELSCCHSHTLNVQGEEKNISEGPTQLDVNDFSYMVGWMPTVSQNSCIRM